LRFESILGGGEADEGKVEAMGLLLGQEGKVLWVVGREY
jgi:hypothetical protein